MYKRLKAACYSGNITMSIIGNLPPLLFLTFRSQYGLSYSLLGLLVMLNFVTQLGIDLIFSFFSHRFNIPRTVKIMPVLSVIGFAVYAAAPILFPNAVYAGLVLGTIIFSASSGLAEVLLSPVIAAIPAEDPDREMSRLHSIYAWGVVVVVIASTLLLLAFGPQSWQAIILLWAVVPLVSAILFAGAEIPKLDTPEKTSGALNLMKNPGLWLCVFAIFLGGASECMMAQWASSYLEQAVGLPKVWGDVFGVALFAVMLGTGRTLYAKIGRNLGTVLWLGAIGAVGCYLVASLCPVPVIGLIACGLTGLCTAMMWPGSLVAATDRFPAGGVFVFALMAAGGDLGASIGPQMIGMITDAVVAGGFTAFGLTPDQLGMRAGMLAGVFFPLCAVFVFGAIRRQRRKAGLDQKGA